MAKKSLTWEGDKVKKKMNNCIMTGINQTMSSASIQAKFNHPWFNRTGTLEGSIRPVVAAHQVGNEFVGLWGSVDVKYAVFLELGTKFFPPFPYLRPAANAQYPNLARNIRNCFEGKTRLVRAETVTLRGSLIKGGETITGFRLI